MKISANTLPIDLARTSELRRPDATSAKGGFTTQLRTLVEDVEETAQQADVAGEGLISGKVELHQAMVSMEKANIAIRVGTTVRNKILDAYRQLSQVSG